MGDSKLVICRLQILRTSAGIRQGWREYSLPLHARMSVLDALFAVLHQHDPSLAFRCACRVGMCGTCAVEINGVPGLACKARATPELRIAPLPNLPVVQDLAVGLDPFFAQWKAIGPRFQPAEPESQTLARIPASTEFARASQSKSDCITCGACFAACGIKATSGEYLGPAAINKAYLRLLDPRDRAKRERAARLDGEREGVWRCHTQFNCTEVCPKGIDLTGTIGRLKRQLLTRWRSA